MANDTEFSFGETVTDDEMDHLAEVLSNPTGPSQTILDGERLLRQLERKESP